MPDGAVIGYDPRLHTPQEIKRLAEKGLSRALEQNPLDAIWADRPDAPASTVESFPAKSAGQSVAEKPRCGRICAETNKQGAGRRDHYAAGFIAWLLNDYGRMVSRIFRWRSSNAVENDGTLGWFIDEKRVPDSVRRNIRQPRRDPAAERLGEEIAKFKGAKLLGVGRAPWHGSLTCWLRRH